MMRLRMTKPPTQSQGGVRMVDYSRPPRARGRIIRAMRALDDHWLGDLIGAVCLFGTIFLMVIVAGVLS